MRDPEAWGLNGYPSVVSVGGVAIEEYARTRGLAAQRPVAESGLPKGEPGGKGIKLDKDIPGEATYSKPEDDIRQPDKAEPGSIYRKDGPDDLAKPQDSEEGDQRQHENFKPRFEGPGGRPPDDPTVTDYPYRDGLPHQHYASEQTEFVAGMYLASIAHELRIQPGNRILVSAKPDEVVTGLNPAFAQRARSCGVTMKRVDTGNLRWLFSVNCGNGPKVVKLKAFRGANVVRLGKMDVDVTCSCPAWQWLGPEHHAQREDYLDGGPRGTASTPVIRDPQGINRVCKHVAAVLSYVQGWEIPTKPKKK
jgi:hypothetical protein